MKNLHKFIKYNGKVFLFELILFIFLLFMTNWILNKSGKIYYAESKEPISNSGIINLNDQPFEQIIFVEGKMLYGIDLLIAPNDDISSRTITINVKDSTGKLLTTASKKIDGTYHNEYILLNKPLEISENRIFCLEFSSSSDIACFTANYDGRLANNEINLYFKMIYDYVDSVFFSKTVYFIVIFTWLIISILINLLRDKLKIEYYFAIFYFIIGLAYMIIMPFSAVPDEPSHFFRCYEISEGKLISIKNEKKQVGDYMSMSLNSDSYGPAYKWRHNNNLKNAEVSNQDINFLEFPNTALYSPFTYTPQVIGISIAKHFTNKVMIIAYMGRIFAWIAVGILLFFSIKYIPFGKLLLSMIALLPMSMQENISMAADGITFAICSSIITFVLYMRYVYQGKMKKKHYIIMYLLIFYISTVKIVYMPLCLMFFLLPIERFGDKKKYRKNVSIAILLAGTVCLTWLKISSSLLVGFNPGSNSDAQVQFILSNIANYINILFNSFAIEGDNYLKTLFGFKLGWGTIEINVLVIYFIIALLIIIAVKDKFIISHKDNCIFIKSIISIVLFSITILIFTSIYVQWTPAYLDYVSGVQGRYFLPLLMPFILLCKHLYPNNKIESNNEKNKINTVSYLSIICINICALVTLSVHFVV